MERTRSKVNWIAPSTPHYKHLERCGRACYQTHDTTTEYSHLRFVRNIVSRKHWSVLEHGVFVFKISPVFFCYLKDIEDRRFINITSNDKKTRFLASGSFRAWMELADRTGNMADRTGNIAALKACQVISRYAPDIFGRFATIENKFSKDDCDINIPFLKTGISFHEYVTHKHYTVSVNTNRGVTHEFVRHRPCAFSQESTRYVRCDENSENFIEPVFWKKWDGKTREVWEDHMLETQERYRFLNGELGLPYQEAREILPNALKAELVITASLAEWLHILILRSGNTAHPEFRKLATEIWELFLEEEDNIFNECFWKMRKKYDNVFYSNQYEWEDVIEPI